MTFKGHHDLLKLWLLPSRTLHSSSSVRLSSSRTYNQPLTFNNIFAEANRLRVSADLAKLPSSYVPPEDLKKAKRSAVLVPLCVVDGEAAILFTVRTLRLTKHRGEVSFPGGMADSEDGGDPRRTALREAEEELGIKADSVDVWGILPSMPSRAKADTMAVPVLGFCDADVSHLTPNPTEVESFFWRSISSLCDPSNVSSTQFRTTSKRFHENSNKKNPSSKHQNRSSISGYVLPVYPPPQGRPPEEKIWGLTAMILHQTLKILATKDLYKYDLKFIS